MHCLWTHSDGAHGDIPYPYLPQPTPTIANPTTPYHYPPLLIPTTTHLYYPLPPPTLPQIMVLKEANS